MRDQASSSNGPANLLMLLGFALLIVGGILAYPSIRGSLALDSAPQGFGDEAVLGGSIIQAGESLPPRVSDPPAVPDAQATTTESADPPPIVLPETPLQSEIQPTPDTSSTISASPTAPPVDPTPTAEPAPAIVDAPTETPQSNDPFTPDVPSRLVIPAIGLDAPVETVGWSVVTQNDQPVSMWDVPNRFAAGWLKTTARVGERGNTVLDGHHNIAGEVFRDLANLKAGDTIQVWAGGHIRDYIVSLMKILPEKGQPIAVRLENAKWIQPTKDERLTLVTCWPYTNNTHRLIVVALPADAPPPPDLGAE